MTHDSGCFGGLDHDLARWQIEGASRSASFKQVLELATASGLSRCAVEIALLEQQIIPERYERNIGALGVAGQLALRRATAIVIGCGGLGGWLAEGLCRLGIGRLRLVDGDVFRDSNLNRQLGCTEATLGRSKALTLAEHLQQVNGAVAIEPVDEHLTSENALALLAGVDVALDALDSIHTRLLLQRTARRLGVALVHGAIAGWTGQVMTVLPNDLGLEAVYGAEPPHDHGVEIKVGTPSPTPMMTAAWMLQECAKLLVGRQPLLRGRLLILDGLYGEATAVELA